MSLVSKYSPQEFTSEFSLDFGSGVRGALVSSEGFKGLIISHLAVANGGTFVCCLVLPLEMPNSKLPPLWGLGDKNPAHLTITGPPIECINCPTNNRGNILKGEWVPVQ
jgi:hypothetical protein